MKRSFILVLSLLFVMMAMGQNRAVLLNESFDGEAMPEGWSIMELGPTNWSISHTDNAGGTPNEVKLTYTPTFNGVSRLVTPALDLTGVESVMFSFKHAFLNYLNSHTIGIATSSDGGATWNEAWSQTYSDDGVYAIVEEVATADMGQPNVQFCIFYSGYSFNIDKWYFDDIQIFTLDALDLGLASIDVAETVTAGNLHVGLSVDNLGLEAVSTVEASYEVEGRMPVTETFEVDIPSLGSGVLNFSVTANLAPGDYFLTCRIDRVNGVVDDYLDNNEASMAVSAVVATPDRMPMIEHFSSSTCGPCVEVNEAMGVFCDNNPGRFTYTKYQMNWPGSGDPYYTEEGGTRRHYYNVNGVPQCFLDGENQGHEALKQSVFDLHVLRPAMMDIRGAFAVEGSVVSITVDVMSFIDAEARIFVSVNEKVTHGNVGGNGETEFHHVFMKMLPDAEGLATTFVEGEVQHLEYSYDMASTHVEEMDDLEVAIWVQDYDTKEVFNSRYAFEYTDEHPYPIESLVLTQDEQAGENTMVTTWDAPVGGTPLGYDVYVNGELVAESITDTQYAFAGELGLYYLVGVRAVYADDKTSVLRLAELTNTWSVGETPASLCQVYPNPANTQVRLEVTQDIESVWIYDVLGALVDVVAVSGTTVGINLGSYHAGMYFFNVHFVDGTTAMQRVVVTH